MRYLPPRVKTALIAFSCLGMGLLLALSPAASSAPRDCDKTMNDTLDMVLLVVADLKGQRPTWQQIENEVAHRMRIKREEPWNKK